MYFLHLRPPPTATFFPYTTLFRSQVVLQRQPRLGRPLGGLGGEQQVLVAVVAAQLQQVEVTGAKQARQRARRDRKSTRLNSSHLVISYAVFCLKKKKKVIYNSTTQ